MPRNSKPLSATDPAPGVSDDDLWDSARARAATAKLERILAMDGMGSIVVKPKSSADLDAEGPVADPETGREHLPELGPELVPDRQAPRATATTRAPQKAPPLVSPQQSETGTARDEARGRQTDRLRAVLERSNRASTAASSSASAIGSASANGSSAPAPAGDREPALETAAASAASPTTATPANTPADTPWARRIEKSVFVEPKPAPASAPGSEHVKLSELKRPAPAIGDTGSNFDTETDTDADAVADQALARLQPRGAMASDDAASRLRHLPDGQRDQLTSFVAEAPPSAPDASSTEASRGQPSQATATPPGPQPEHKPAAQSAQSQKARPTAPPLGQTEPGGEIKQALRASRRAFLAAGLFSFFINMLMLTGPLFMLQVYDRVMTSASIPTLVVLFAMTAFLYGIMGLLELARSRIVVRIGVDVDERIGKRVFQATLRRSLTQPDAARHSLRELDHLRSFLAGPGPLTFFDAPWTPIYLLIIFALHWILGLAALAGAAILLTLALVSELHSRRALQKATSTAAATLELADTGQRNAEAITAMGMFEAYRARWKASNDQSLAWQIRAADRLGSVAAMSKSLRLLMQSSMLALGAWLALSNEISAGSIVAASIIFGRALSPVEQAIGQWKPFVRAREAYARLTELLAKVPPPQPHTQLPRPEGRLSVENLRVASPDTNQLILSNLNFMVPPGHVLAVVGPSASGKSTLARALVGLWPPFGGSIRLDGARLDQWDPENLGQHIGYVPQAVELFTGTVRENIARYRDDASDEAVIAAAKMAHAHELIVALPQGYDTELGSAGTHLSGGQRQRLGLARALFNDPAIVVLDEPNANLDRQGDEALDAAIIGMRERGQTVVIISHRVGALSKADLMLYIDRGMQRAFGPRAEVLAMLRGDETKPRRRAGDKVGARPPQPGDAVPATARPGQGLGPSATQSRGTAVRQSAGPSRASQTSQPQQGISPLAGKDPARRPQT